MRDLKPGRSIVRRGCAIAALVALSWASVPVRGQAVYDGAMPEATVAAPKASQRWSFPVTGGFLSFVPYGPNVVRVTLTQGDVDRVIPSGWGILASPSGESGWSTVAGGGTDTLRSDRMSMKVDKTSGGFAATRADGRPICEFLGGTLTAATLNGQPSHAVDGVFSSGDDEHYFGLGQHQDGTLDLRGRKLNVWHQYGSHETVGVPFLVSTRNYAIVWDNPSRSTLECANHGKTTWHSEVGDAVSFFLIVGNDADEIYSAYRNLTGAAPMPPKAALGLIQSKARYATQEELLAVAQGYRQRHDPCDIIVVDYLHWRKLGDLALDPKFWPDSVAMTRQLHELGFKLIISIWPDFAAGSAHYDEVVAKKLVLTDAHGAVAAMPHDPMFHRDACIDSTNPAARAWLWKTISSGYGAEGFDYFWMDETEPDVEWHDLLCSLGPCAAVYNVYPLMHNSAIYGGHRSVSNERMLILTRAAYLGSQRNGTTFWSSDIAPAWKTLRAQIPTGLNMCASGMPYWSSDTGGWQPLPKSSHPSTLLLDPSDARKVIGQDDDYPELFVRWFQYSTFCPTLRAHGNRKEDELWSFGKAAETILKKYVTLRYQLMPYIYSQAHRAQETGAPFMRALFMDFPADEKVFALNDEYMFGPAFLVAPITSQGTTQRTVYLPAGTDWYDYWTNQRYHGGQTITADAPIETLPLYVRAGSILPLGSAIENTEQPQTISELRVYQGADGEFALYNDDGHTYAYEKGEFELADLRYSDASKSFSISGKCSLLGSGVQPTFVDGVAK